MADYSERIAGIFILSIIGIKIGTQKYPNLLKFPFSDKFQPMVGKIELKQN